MPQYSVDSRTIENVIGYIKDGQISIPEIQRPFVWDGSKIRDLIDSLYHGYPVGYLIVWQNPNMKDKTGNTTIGKKIMIDGQQRVTAIMTAIVGLKVLDQNFNERVYKIAFNPYAADTDNCFEVQSAAILKDKKWIQDISVIFDTDFRMTKFMRAYCDANPDEDGKLEEYKKIITEEFYPTKGRQEPKTRFAVCRKTVSDYKKLKPSPDKLADLMLYYVENACRFTYDYGDMWEQYYTSVENNFDKTMAFIAKNNLLNHFKPRLQMCVEWASPCGWGFADTIADIYYEYFPED